MLDTRNIFEAPPRSSLWTATWFVGFILAVLVIGLLVLPMFALGQTSPVEGSPDYFVWIAKIVIGALRGDDRILAVLAGLVGLVAFVRFVLAQAIPGLKAWLSTDIGGVVVTVATICPTVLLTARLAGQSLSLGLVIAALGGPAVLYGMGRKL